jgi:hypothetical protein
MEPARQGSRPRAPYHRRCNGVACGGRRPLCVNRLKNRHLAKPMSDAGWDQFLSIVSFKAVCAGRSVAAVPPTYTSQRCTSQICSGCGVIVQKGLSARWHECPDCGTSLHRTPTPPRTSSGSARAFGESRGYLRQRGENPWGVSPYGVSGHASAAGMLRCDLRTAVRRAPPSWRRHGYCS